MRCPACNSNDSKVVDSRPTDEGASIRRRRECLNCQKRFTTYETVETIPLIVVKKDNSRVPFDRNKVLGGIIKACEKRPVSMDSMQQITSEIEHILQNRLVTEVSTSDIGELVMERLKTLDAVAYVRFASVYREFKDVSTFMDELKKLMEGH